MDSKNEVDFVFLMFLLLLLELLYVVEDELILYFMLTFLVFFGFEKIQ